MQSQSEYANSNRHNQLFFSNVNLLQINAECVVKRMQRILMTEISSMTKYIPVLSLKVVGLSRWCTVSSVKYSVWSAGGIAAPWIRPKQNRCSNSVAALQSHAHWMIWHIHSYFTLGTFSDYFHPVALGKINLRSMLCYLSADDIEFSLQLNILWVAESEFISCS